MLFTSILLLLWFPDPSISTKVQQFPPDVVKLPEASAQFNCSHSISGYERVFWYKQTESGVFIVLGHMNLNFDNIEAGLEKKISLQGDGRNNSTLTVLSISAADTAVYFCAATRQGEDPAYFGSGTKLTVLEHDIKYPEVKVLPPSPQEICDKKAAKKNIVTLVCVVTDFYPDHIKVKWRYNGYDMGTKGVSTDDRALWHSSNKTYSITSRFLISAKQWFNTMNTFTCEVEFYNGTVYVSHEGSIKGVKGSGLNAETIKQDSLWAKLSYGILIEKSFLYGLFVFAVVWKVRRSSEKRM